MKRVSLGVVMLCSMVFMGACYGNETQQEVKASINSNFEAIDEGGYTELADGLYSTEIVDNETGVHYLVISSSRADGGISITPLYNADGTLKVN